uniref:Uncharacterized protein n=1 Tax=Chromera velia CCMP2878 TaxID=1169474 RepID=A0A0G4HKR8_9ALVE|mmetsp:Transcript_10202/g.19777  ORF Transcript_10202/g.19777 Transcript_10202/m.19777 type:complete len:257 (-) Transcript_10202:87-857(-)|eukprot:Cvel_28604.t1-p1 / transcript=Cvel_28604.t1 / gene=Cvel_28604 / organism=Chromera_velia_CCMP2878 / gene_product=Methylmalonic aciduria and homocystinuria type D, putative / transcript_product=Methylmalonic aciduria and homocystinuria type D, putative / location=Cvel_scaffold3773:1980-5291(-) / protein_length=256 / sequence_SO=supercontig / SO=protein_coding / is_pseudo=false
MDEEVKLHVLTGRSLRDLEDLFPVESFKKIPVKVITLALRTKNPMTAMTTQTLEERDACFKTIVERFPSLREWILADETTAFCDFIDPSTGAPFHTDSATTFMETDDRVRKFGLRIEELGCCRAVSHPLFRANCVVGFLFAGASEERLQEAVRRLGAGPEEEAAEEEGAEAVLSGTTQCGGTGTSKPEGARAKEGAGGEETVHGTKGTLEATGNFCEGVEGVMGGLPVEFEGLSLQGPKAGEGEEQPNVQQPESKA